MLKYKNSNGKKVLVYTILYFLGTPRRSCNLQRRLGVSYVASLQTAPDIQTTGSGCCPEEWQRRISNLHTGCDGAQVSERLIQTSTVTDSPGNLFDPGFCHVSKSKVIRLSEWSRREISVGENICYSLMDFLLSCGLESSAKKRVNSQIMTVANVFWVKLTKNVSIFHPKN